MADLFDNPMGLMGFEFVEFSAPNPGFLEPAFEKLGFTRVAVHRSKDVALYRQGAINFIVNNEPKSNAAYFAAEHGPADLVVANNVYAHIPDVVGFTQGLRALVADDGLEEAQSHLRPPGVVGAKE